MSGDSQFQGATVFKALVQRGFELHPDGVRVVLLGLGLMAAYHLGKTRPETSTSVRSESGAVCYLAVNNRSNGNEGRLCVSHLASLVGSVLLEDVASSDHHPGCLDTVERSALLLLHQDLINKTNQLTKRSIALITLIYNLICFVQISLSFIKAFTFKKTAVI